MMTFFNSSKLFLIIGTIAFMVVAGSWVGTLNKKLETSISPNGIGSLAVAWDQKNAADIVDAWEAKDLTKIVFRAISVDYLFIAAYTIFLLMCVLARNNGPAIGKITKIFFAVCLLAAGFDIIENTFMTMFLSQRSIAPAFFAVPAYLKFALLLLTSVHILLFLRNYLWFFPATFKALRLYFPGLLTVIISYWLFVNLPVGQDVIMQIGEFGGPFGWSLVCIVLWSLYTWYSSRLVGYTKQAKTQNSVPKAFHDHVPRLIAFNALVSIQAAIFALPTIGNLSELQVWAFVIIHNCFYFAFDNLYKHKMYSARTVLTIVSTLGYIGWVVVAEIRAIDARHQFWLPLIAFLLYAFELLLLYGFLWRREAILRSATIISGEQHTAPLLLFGIKVIQLPAYLIKEEQKYFNGFNIIAGIGLFLYLGGFLCLWLADHMGTLASVLLAFGILVGASNILTVASVNTNTNFFFYLFLMALVVGRLYDPYKVRLTESKRNEIYESRPHLETYLNLWVDHRRTKILDADSVFNTYLVIADGGASRSGYWVASVLSELQDSTIRSGQKDLFSDHIFCLAGASGGSVGTATFYALLKDNRNNEAAYLAKTRNFLGEDFLTPVVNRLLGSDIIQHVFPLFIGDRAVGLEKSMEYFSKEHGIGFEKNVSEVMDTSGKLPALFINTTHVQQGAPAVISTIQLDSFSRRIDVLDTIALTKREGKGDIRFSTAVVLGARFPYVSPAGRIRNNYFVDGGYFDNTGAGIVHEMVQKLDSIIKKKGKDPLLSKLRFNVLYLSNSSLTASAEESIHPLINNAAAPLLTVLGTYASQTSVNNERLFMYIRSLKGKKVPIEFNLYTKDEEIDYPMNWVISIYNLQRMDSRLEAVKKNEFEKLMLFKK